VGHHGVSNRCVRGIGVIDRCHGIVSTGRVVRVLDGLCPCSWHNARYCWCCALRCVHLALLSEMDSCSVEGVVFSPVCLMYRHLVCVTSFDVVYLVSATEREVVMCALRSFLIGRNNLNVCCLYCSWSTDQAIIRCRGPSGHCRAEEWRNISGYATGSRRNHELSVERR
jgi:hypothetical protein